MTLNFQFDEKVTIVGNRRLGIAEGCHCDTVETFISDQDCNKGHRSLFFGHR
ncbi:MAG: hypothetical protein PVI90_09500 [Desulfobacteraceae bacterium]